MNRGPRRFQEGEPAILSGDEKAKGQKMKSHIAENGTEDQGASPPVSLGVYIHIPFCRTLCPYCDFVRTPLAGEVPEGFIEALCAEIRAFEGPCDADSVYFGGGTPSLLSPSDLESLLLAAGERFSFRGAEVSIEANPDDVTRELADAWRALGVNRVSLGVQSFSDPTLMYLGRRHNATAARRACEWIAERFENWSMDLIFGADAVADWDATLRACAEFAPKHVSSYGLTYEEGTPFGARADEAIGESEYLDCFWRPERHLASHLRYEISNLALPGHECRHNLKYWRNEAYAGFGPGAYAFVDGVRARNQVELDAYLAAPLEKAEALRLTDDEIRTETLIQHFRLKQGLPEADYFARFNRHMRDDFGPQLDTLIARGLIEKVGSVWRPTRKGFELNNEIGLELVSVGASPEGNEK
jgi:putative oxygen-independent coproporphyrinogen III oxidase